MTAAADALSRVRLDGARRHRNLSVFPLIADLDRVPDYLLLDEALGKGLVRVTEVSDSGRVPELKLVNDAERPVLLLDGEELVGAKQNRILNVTVLAPAKSTVLIPVSCVEAGRWRYERKDFTASDRTHYASGRARKAESVSDSLRYSRSHRSDQAAVWEDIESMSACLGAESATSAAAALYESHREALQGYVEAFEPVAGQVGALFAIGAEPAGLELFDSSATFATLLPKLVRSYALDAVDALARAGADPGDPVPPAAAERLFTDAAVAREERFLAVGLGEDLRLTGPFLTGGALEAGGRVVHLCAFRLRDGSPGGGRPARPLARASARRSGRS